MRVEEADQAVRKERTTDLHQDEHRGRRRLDPGEAQHAAAKLEKLLLSAISAWEAKNTDVKLEEADLFVKEIFVDGGRQLKRLRPAPQGRAHRIRKRSNHVTLIVDRMPVEVEAKSKKETK